MSTPTIDQMKRAVAEMLPESIEVIENHYADGSHGFYWLGEPVGDTVRDSLDVAISEREWLHVCWLAEQTLTTAQCFAYKNLLQQMVLKAQAICSLDFVFGACLEQRIEALCRVKRHDLFNPSEKQP